MTFVEPCTRPHKAAHEEPTNCANDERFRGGAVIEENSNSDVHRSHGQRPDHEGSTKPSDKGEAQGDQNTADRTANRVQSKKGTDGHAERCMRHECEAHA